MSNDDDRKLLSLLESLSPDHVQRLKSLADSRKAVWPGPPTDGPETYRGVTVPEALRPNWDQPEAHFWRQGADVALEATAPMLMAWADPKPCAVNEQGECLIHDYPPPLCPDGEARRILREMGRTNQ
jgi:hypothetical protein